ncbi:MAG TPA: DUF3857 domain-containing protein [Flavobacterium sp.]|nr:DUF3857 domain-containing protein [Flavobacterium sp.]
MKITKLLITLFLLAFFSKAAAQKFELGKVSLNELQEKTHPIDTSAAAAILYNKARTFFVYNITTGFSINTEYEFRIKIYKKEGLKWANHQVHYYVGYEHYNDDMVSFSKAVTYNLENGAIVKTKLDNEGTFKKNVNEYWNEASITMPNVKVGSIIEFKYVLKSENIVAFPVFNFQYDVPVNYSQYITEVPGLFIYKPVLTGYFKVQTDQKIANGFQNFVDKYGQSTGINYKQINSSYIAENVPALKEENYVDNIQNYRSSLQHELERTQFPDEPVKDYSETWEGVAKIIYQDKSFGKELGERDYITQDLKRILKDINSIPERVDIIFKFVQNKMNWNNQKGYLTDVGVKKAYIAGTGNVAEINFILIAMLNYAGIQSNPVLISTTEHGIPVFPNRTIFNYVIAATEIDGKQVLLDATNKKTTLNILPLNTLNWTGRLIRQDGSSHEINLVPTTLTTENANLMVLIDNMGMITGRARNIKTDYDAFNFRERYEGISKEIYLEKLENKLNGIQINDYSIDNIKDFSKPIIENFTFTADNQCEIIGGKIYFDPLLFFTQTKNPFIQEKRELPIYFGYPKQSKYNISIQIPEGYSVEIMPKPIKISTVENVILFTFNIFSEGNKIQVQITREMNTAIVSAEYYDVLKDFHQKMIDKLNEKIVLKKI